MEIRLWLRNFFLTLSFIESTFLRGRRRINSWRKSIKKDENRMAVIVAKGKFLFPCFRATRLYSCEHRQ